MANDCLPQLNACAMRVARLEADGVPLPGSHNLYVSDALVKFQFKWVIEQGQDVKEKNACGSLLLNYKGPASLLRGDVTIDLLTPDPELSEMLGNGVVLTSGAAVGYGSPALGTVPTDAVSIELWAQRIRDGKLDTTFPYAWWAYPWITNLRPADHEHGQKNLGASFVGEAYSNDNWANGPLNDWPVASDLPYQWVPTTSVPAASCGYKALAAS